MANGYDDTNRGALFIQNEKKSEKAPDYSGTLNVEGKEWRIAGWRRESKNGNKFISIVVSEPQQQGGGNSSKPADNDSGW